MAAFSVVEMERENKGNTLCKNSPKSENALENEPFSRAMHIGGNIKMEIPFNGHFIIVRGRNFRMNPI